VIKYKYLIHWFGTSGINMRISGLDEQIHIIDNNVTIEEIIKDIVGANVIITYFVSM